MENVLNQIMREDEERKAEFVRCTGEAIPVEIAIELDALAYFMCPAGKTHHGSYPGGLYDHSIRVAQELCDMTRKLDLQWERPESPIIVGVFHDICKTLQYDIIADESKEEGYRIEYRKDNYIAGHGEASIYLIDKLEKEFEYFKLTDEEKACIRYHMGAYAGKQEWSTLDAAIRRYPNIIYTHTADMVVSKIYGI